MSSECTIVLKLDGFESDRPVIVVRRRPGDRMDPFDIGLRDPLYIEIAEDGVVLVEQDRGRRMSLDQDGWRSAGPWSCRLGGATRSPGETIFGADSWASPEIRVHDGLERPPLRRVLPLKDGLQFVIGRSAGADLSVDDDLVSRRHCRIFVRQGVHYLEDEGSSHGTYLNGERVFRASKLSSGDRVEIGGVTIEYLSYADTVRTIGQLSTSTDAPATAMRMDEPKAAVLAAQHSSRWVEVVREEALRLLSGCRAAVRRPDLILAALFIGVVVASIVLLGRDLLMGQ